ncbi:MAG: Integrase catalytic region, partial [Geminicoccaceae bacterium]|nr:Integrase catalytic region [Geminicoccaceae bacterium]
MRVALARSLTANLPAAKPWRPRHSGGDRAVADALGVARPNLAERRTRRARPRGPYRKPEDAALLPTIREIVDARPTYGYRRITA